MQIIKIKILYLLPARSVKVKTGNIYSEAQNIPSSAPQG